MQACCSSENGFVLLLRVYQKKLSVQGAVLNLDATSTSGLPILIYKAIFMYRNGSRDTMLRQVRPFGQVRDRGRLLVNYSHSVWKKGGQNNALYRFIQVVQLLLEFAPVVCILQNFGKKDHWSYVVQKCHAQV